MINTVILFSPGPFGGAEQVILKSTQDLNARIWLIKETRNPIPCEEFEKRCQEEGIDYKIFQCESRLDLKTLNELNKAIVKWNIKLIHSHGMKANYYNSRLKTKSNIKCIATQHGKTSHSLKTKFLEYLEHRALTKMDMVICVSEAMYIKEKYKNKILVENFLSSNIRKINYRNKGKLKLVSIGRLSPEKGIADAISAISDLEEVYLTVVGVGSELQFLKQLAHSKSNINFVGFKQDITNYLQEADALIIPSHREGLPMILLEATAAGLPILASNIGGMPKLVQKNGILFEAKNIQDIRKKIILFTNDRTFFNERAKDHSLIVKEKYSKSGWIKKITNLYKSLL